MLYVAILCYSVEKVNSRGQWDNRIVMHRATSNWDNQHLRRDMRRTSNFDAGPGARGPDDIGKHKEAKSTA